MQTLRVGLLTSVGTTLDAFFPPLVEEWTRRGYAVFPASGTSAVLDGTAVLDGVTRRPSLAALRSRRTLQDWVADNHLDIVLTNTAVASTLVRSAVTTVPIVYFCHGLHWASRRDMRSRIAWEPIERGLLHRTAAAIVLNSHDEDWFLSRMPPERVLRLNAGVGVPLADFPRANQFPIPPLRLAWAGEFSKRKRPSDALDVVAHLRSEFPHVRLDMYGTGSLHADVREEVVDRNLSHNVALPGRGNVARLLAESHLLLHTAAWEGLVRVALEAAAVGRWTYGYRVKGVIDTPAARVVPFRDTRGLAALIANDYRTGKLHDVPTERSQLAPQIAAREIGQLLERLI
ncbi:hypothetical protein DQ239_18670 [Blastococcus sp. TF02-09]|nr:hypothetical protein DQ239_18670 [Blastococcus sp. TF02-9]